MFSLNEEVYLKVELNQEIGKPQICLKNREEVFDSWTPQTRISPVFLVNSNKSFSTLFEKKCFQLFLYNCRPSDYLKQFGDCGFPVFITYGLANLTCISESKEDIEKIINWANSSGFRYEEWIIEGSYLIKTKVSYRKFDQHKVALLKIENQIIKVLYEEYLSNFLSLITEIEYYIPKYLSQFNSLNDIMQSYLVKENEPTENKIEFLISVNAGISRVLGQIFSGSSGILNNPCPIGNHSLLGIGIANISLINLCEFYDFVIGKEYFPDRVVNLAKIGIDDPEQMYYFDNDKIKIHEAYKQEFINRLGIPNIDKNVPVLPFFSGRDGFKSGNRISISVPLIVLSSCNCLSWNLLTLTHELSHLQIRGVLSFLIPEETDASSIRNIFNSPKSEIKNLFEYGRYLLCLATTTISKTKSPDFKITDIKGQKLSPNFSGKILVDVDETLTHIFDFLYFFDGDIKKYLSSIWSSWVTIPYIEDRIEDYLVRTGTAILSNNLHESDQKLYIFTELKTFFEIINKSMPHKYFTQALSMINSENVKSRIFYKITARLPLIVLARTQLYSTKVSGRINKELNIYSKHSGTDGYKLKVGTFEINDDRITNPFAFLKEFSIEEISSEKNSLWILYNLCFM